ncbi:MAG: phosphate ABC transporter permease PstA [Chloroflexota bacterium]
MAAKSLINLTEEQHKSRLQNRHLRGTIYANLYRLSLVLAVIALISLLLQISSQAFGPVLTVPRQPLNELTDTPREELTELEIATIFVEEVGNELLTLVRDRYGAVRTAEFPSMMVAESLAGNQLPPSVEENAGDMTFRDMSDEEIAEFLVLNSTRDQLDTLLEREVIRPDIIGEWTWIAWVFNRDTVYNEASAILTEDLARDVQDVAEDNGGDLVGALIPYVGTEANAQQVAADFESVSNVLTATDWDVEQRRVRASVGISERRGGGTQTPTEVSNAVERTLRPELIDVILTEAPTVTEFAAANIADELARDIVRGGGLDELGSSEQRAILGSLMIPAFADVLEAGEFEGGDLSFISWLNGRFLTETGSNSVPEEVTLRVAVLGSIWVMVITILTSFPLGVGAAIYLEEYATDNWLNNLIETNIRNLAGVPSIIYGLMGLAVFVRVLSPITSGEVFGTPGTTGRTVLSAGLTLALLILPVIIINSQEAIRAVPSDIRQASYGLGATKWQTIWRQILPAAFPGIMTGTILAFSRAVGETAPLIVVGAAAAISVDPNLFSSFTVIPIQIFNWTENARPEYQHLAAAAIVVLLALLLLLNSAAILLRNRFAND